MTDFKILFTSDQIRNTLNRIAQEIVRDIKGEEFVVIGVLTGAYVFTADLTREIWKEGHEKFEIDFVKISSYMKGKKSSGKPILSKDIETNITNRNILIIEDIIESGHTLKFLIDHLKKQKPKNIRICSLLSKPLREVDIEPDYLGFTVNTNDWVEGYGLDTGFLGRGRGDIVVRI